MSVGIFSGTLAVKENVGGNFQRHLAVTEKNVDGNFQRHFGCERKMSGNFQRRTFQLCR